MSAEQVCVALLRKWIHLDIPDIERLIDAVPAYDIRGISICCHVKPSDTDIERKAFTVEWSGTAEEWKKRRICSQDAKLLADGIKHYSAFVASLFNEHDAILGKPLPSSDPALNEQLREEQIREIDLTSYDLPSMVYEKFLGVLHLNFDEAVKHIASNPFRLKADAPESIALRFRGVAQYSSAESGTSPLPMLDTRQTLVPVNVPASLWAGKPIEDAVKNLQGKFAKEVIAYILVEKMRCSKTSAGRYLDAKTMDEGIEKDSGTYQRSINELLKNVVARYTFTFDG